MEEREKFCDGEKFFEFIIKNGAIISLTSTKRRDNSLELR
jgi:hypothetical protein